MRGRKYRPPFEERVHENEPGVRGKDAIQGKERW